MASIASDRSVFVPLPYRRPQRLRRYLTVAYGGTLLVMLVLFTLATAAFTYQTEVVAWRSYQAELASGAAAKVSAQIEQARNALRFAGLPGANLFQAAPRIVQDLLDHDPDLLEIVRANYNGEVSASSFRDGAVLATLGDIPGSEWFRSAQAGISYISDPQYPAVGAPYVILALRTLDGGVVAARLSMEALWSVVSQINFGEGGNAYVISRQNRVIAHRDRRLVASNRPPAKELDLQAILAAPDNRWVGDSLGLDGGAKVTATAAIPGTTWIVLTELPQAEAFANSRAVMFVLIPVALLMGALVAVVTRRALGSLIFSPLDTLRRGTRRIGGGDFSYRLGLKRNDEIGQVADAFDAMADHLQDRDRELAARNQALAAEVEERRRIEQELQRAKNSLEARVAERTRELLEANGQLEFELAERRRAEQRTAAFITLGQQLNSTSKDEDAARIIMRVADDLLGFDACDLKVLLPLENLYYPICQMDVIEGQRVEVPWTEGPTEPTPIVRAVMAGGGRLFFTDDSDGILAGSPRFGDTSRLPESLIAVPIRHGQRTIGVVTVQSYQPHAYDVEALHTLQGLADHCGGALERMSAEKELRAYTGKLERSNRELQEFAYVASHDLQEPLRKIQAFGNRLRDRYGGALDEQGRDYLARMETAAARMQTLIEGLLVYSRVTTKAQPFARVNLTQVAAEVISDLETRIGETGGQVDVDELGCIEADPLQIRQLLQNLIGNALKFHRPDTAPIVHVHRKGACANGGSGSGGCDDAAESTIGEQCVIAVEDNGIGFDEKYGERIFQVFQRLHSRGTYDGAGIGLAVCRKIVDRHGGSILARSVPGQGSAFLVTLPVRQA